MGNISKLLGKYCTGSPNKVCRVCLVGVEELPLICPGFTQLIVQISTLCLRHFCSQ